MLTAEDAQRLEQLLMREEFPQVIAAQTHTHSFEINDKTLHLIDEGMHGTVTRVKKDDSRISETSGKETWGVWVQWQGQEGTHLY